VLISWIVRIKAGFFTSGDTTANLNEVGKVPRVEDGLARVEINSEKTVLHDLMREIGI